MTSAAAPRRDDFAHGGLPAVAWPVFQAVFLASGFAALLYQMIWQRLLTLFGGADVYSVTLIVSAFMAGLGLGSLAGGHVADRLSVRRRLHAFALSELAIALFGAASVWILYDVLYARLGAVDLPPWATAAVLFGVLLWPTFFMGVSLPLLSRALSFSTEMASRRIASLYGWNTVGAALGSLLSVWVILRMMDFRQATWLGAALNAACAVAALWLARSVSDAADPAERAEAPEAVAAPTPGAIRLGAWIALYALSGFIALSLEIVWFRLLGVILKSISFTFASLLALFLTGVGAGSLLGHRLAARVPHPARAFLILQAAIPLYAALSLAFFLFAAPRFAASVAITVSVFRGRWGPWASTAPTGRMATGRSLRASSTSDQDISATMMLSDMAMKEVSSFSFLVFGGTRDQPLVPGAPRRLRSILPRSFLGSEPTNSTSRGYLNGASRPLTNSCSSRARPPSPGVSRDTTYALGLMRPSASLYPITAHSATRGCCRRQFSTSLGLTKIPPTLSMSSVRPSYQK